MGWLCVVFTVGIERSVTQNCGFFQVFLMGKPNQRRVFALWIFKWTRHNNSQIGFLFKESSLSLAETQRLISKSIVEYLNLEGLMKIHNKKLIINNIAIWYYVYVYLI